MVGNGPLDKKLERIRMVSRLKEKITGDTNTSTKTAGSGPKDIQEGNSTRTFESWVV